jgi:L-seryl-tRNA(Ser) seleniumtransferase
MISKERLRFLPSVEQVKQSAPLTEVANLYPEPLLSEAVRMTIDVMRARLLESVEPPVPLIDGKLSLEALAQDALSNLKQMLSPSLVPVVNATGVIVHTNLGRAPLGKAIWSHMERVATGYSNLEYDLEAGRRGSRHQHLEAVMRRFTGAEACVVVNNNAAAVLLVLTALARGREVIISRGELIEIGGSFRIPDIMAQGGAILRETGTTNRTWLRDYEAAISPQTGLLMKAHRSNFSVTGFVNEVDRAELATLARDRSIPFYEDLGSGLLDNLESLGIAPSEQVASAIKEGVDLVSFSGDKMLGGPQAGIILGRADLIAQLQKHPLTRALRPDKVTLAGLEAVTLAHIEGRARREVPVLNMITRTVEEVRTMARELAADLEQLDGISVSVIDSEARIGGGSEPGLTVPSAAVKVTGRAISETRIEETLRLGHPPIIVRVEGNAVVLDARTLSREELPAIIEACDNLTRNQ